MRPALASRHLPLVALVLLATCACSEEPKKPPAPLVPFDVWERERNDDHWSANNLGWLAVGDDFVIGGSIRDDAFDPYDGFELRAMTPCAVRFALEPLDGVSDLDLCVWDPWIGDFAFCFQSAAAVELGVFNIHSGGAQFHLVVASYVGRSEYRLRVRCEPLGLGLSAGAAPAAETSSVKQAQFEGYRPSVEPRADAANWRPLWLVEYDLSLDTLEVRQGAWRRDTGAARVDARASER